MALGLCLLVRRNKLKGEGNDVLTGNEPHTLENVKGNTWVYVEGPCSCSGL